MADEIMETTAHDDLENRLMTFFIKDVIYGIRLRHVIEIISIQYITKVPNVPNYVKGIINLRGKIVPVVDTRLKIGIEETEYDDKTCIIVIMIGEMQIGLIVDSVNEVLTITKDAVTRMPDISEQKTKKYLQSVTKMNDQMILHLDLDYLINDDNIEMEL